MLIPHNNKRPNGQDALMSVASKAKKEAKKQIRRLQKVKSPKRAQLARLERERETVRTADIAISAEQETEGKSLEELRAMREESMDARAGLKGQAKFDEALQARAYADAMRAITGRQMGQGTAYTGPGAHIQIDPRTGKPRVTTEDQYGGGVPAGSIIYDIDPEAYIKRFRPKFQPTEEQLARAGGPGAWASGLLSGGDDFTYLTPWQQANFQWMLEDQDLGGILGPVGDKSARLPSQWRTDWRKEDWGDTFNTTTNRWERSTDSQVRQNAVEEQLRRYNEGLFNPGTGQPPVSTGPPAWGDEEVEWPWDETTTTILDKSGDNPSVGGVGGGGHYYADPYRLPHMQRGAEWEGLGAEYQPGTVEGLGLISGKAYAPYEPLRTGLLNARPEFMGTPKGFTPFNFEGGIEGSTTKTKNNTNAAGQTFQITSGSVAGGDAVWGWV